MLPENAECVRVFKAFSDGQRIAVLKILGEGEKCACQLLEHLDICQSSLSYHMRILVESGVVENRQEGKWIYYRISGDGKSRAVAILDTITTVREVAADCARCC